MLRSGNLAQRRCVIIHGCAGSGYSWNAKRRLIRTNAYLYCNNQIGILPSGIVTSSPKISLLPNRCLKSSTTQLGGGTHRNTQIALSSTKKQMKQQQASKNFDEARHSSNNNNNNQLRGGGVRHTSNQDKNNNFKNAFNDQGRKDSSSNITQNQAEVQKENFGKIMKKLFAPHTPMDGTTKSRTLTGAASIGIKESNPQHNNNGNSIFRRPVGNNTQLKSHPNTLETMKSQLGIQRNKKDINLNQQQGSKSVDPIEELRRRFAPVTTTTTSGNNSLLNDIRNNSKSTISKLNEMPTSSNSSRLEDNQRKSTSPSLSSSSVNSSGNDAVVSSPLSEFIKAAQLRYAESVAKQKAASQQTDDNSGKSGASSDLFDLMSATSSNQWDSQLPKWRVTAQSYPKQQQRSSNDLREMRRKTYEQMNSPQSTVQTQKWLSKHGDPDDERNKKYRRRQSAATAARNDQLVIIPAYSVSLSEASLIFREKSEHLKRHLISLGLLDDRRRNNQLPTDDDNNSNEDDTIVVDADTMELLAMELGVPFERKNRRGATDDNETLLQRRLMATQDDTSTTDQNNVSYSALPPRPPVVCIMGHVDHGKTTLMDALRKRAATGRRDKGKSKKKSKSTKNSTSSAQVDSVAGTEAGGITQMISAFQVKLTEDETSIGNRSVTFLDTPGHAAFKCMRQSGSDAADVIVLVIAADDGVSEQTVEILDFYKSIVQESNGSISLVIAMNKIDKHGLNIDECQRRIENQLMEHGIITESRANSLGGVGDEYGPPVQLIPVSGLTGLGLDELIEGLLIQSEIMDLRADDSARAEGLVMDARVDKGLGIVVDCIIRWGSIQKGDIVVSGTSTGKVRLLKDVQNNQLKKGLPSQPVRIIGFDSVPKAGEPVIVVASEEMANDLVFRRKAAAGSLEIESSTSNVSIGAEPELQSSGKHMLNETWRSALETKHELDTDEQSGIIRIPIIIKADADGTLSAVREALVQLGEMSKHNILIDPVKTGVGPVLATEIVMAKECNASIFCFNLKNEQSTVTLANDESVPMIRSDVIYRLLDEAKVQFANYLPPRYIDVVHGRAKVQAIYKIDGAKENGAGTIAGLQVTEGTLFKSEAKSNGNQRSKNKQPDGAFKNERR